jgi:hypothetical protein
VRERLFLARKGVPWDVAWDLPPDEALAYTVILGEYEGGVFDWQRMKWKDPK